MNGVRAVSNNYLLNWPNGLRGVCGDPAATNPRQWEIGAPGITGTPVKTYKKGGTMDVSFFVSAFHNGKYTRVLKP